MFRYAVASLLLADCLSDWLAILSLSLSVLSPLVTSSSETHLASNPIAICRTIHSIPFPFPRRIPLLMLKLSL